MAQSIAFHGGPQRAVLITRRHDERLQSSPVAAVAVDERVLLVASRERSAKVANLRRDDRVSLCLLSDDWYGSWVHIDGTAEVVTMPEALPLLMEYKLRVAPDFEDWGTYGTRMAAENRVAIRIVIVGATRSPGSNRE